MSLPRIIDLSAGNRSMWFDRKDPTCTFVDKRPEVRPDIVADSRNLGETVGKDYDLVVFDPPHTNTGPNSDMSKTYGYLTGAEITDLIRSTAREAHRITRPGGLLSFKWSDRDRKLESVLPLFDPYWRPLFGQRLPAGRRRASNDKITNTHWIMMLRRDSAVNTAQEE